MKKETYKLDQETVDLVRHIFAARIDLSKGRQAYIAYCNARDIFEYALAGNKDALKEWAYLMTQEDVEKIQKKS